jgi:hypothetical protein
MNFNSDFDLKKAKSRLLSEGYQEQGFENEDEMQDYYNDSNFIDETLNNDDIIYDRLVDMDHEQLVSTLLRTAEDNPSITLEEFLNEYGFSEDEELNENQLEEMAKIAGDLKSSIEAVIKANPELQGLALKKAIKGDSAVIDALDGDDLYDNQLNKFIALSRGEREVGQRGRKADPNKPAAAPKAEKSPKVKITNPKAAAKTAAPTSKLADLAPTSIFGGEEADEEDMAAEKQAIAAAKGGKRLGSAAEKLAQVTKEMKALIPAYQAAKGTPKAAAITAQLKDLTAEKKALEAKVFK